ncbi:MAG: homoaconitase [Planctomycetota bacterium]|jgi:homoaconitate hydratase
MSTHNASLTLVEKIATAHAVGLAPGAVVRSGDFLEIRPKHVMTHDNTSAVMGKFRSIFPEGRTPRVHDPRQPVFAIDHDIQNTTPENLGKYAKIESFANEQGIDFYPAGTGISHQVMVEYGYVTPGSMVVGSDSHSNLYGAASALGTPVVRTDAASLWATGRTWWQVPPVARVTLTGRLRPGVVGKDVIIALCGLFNRDEVLNHAVEFAAGDGEAIAQLTMDQRMSIANMTTEWGALAGVFPFDEVLRDSLLGRADYLAARSAAGAVDNASGAGPRYTRDDVAAWYDARLAADADAHYAVELTLDLATVIPHVSGPDHVKVMHALPEIERERVKIDKAYLLSCVNARLEDLAEAARVVAGRHVADGVEFYVAAASANVQEAAEARGDWRTLLDAGAIPLPPGCGTCIGLGRGTLDAGEVAISATNRNFKGRMGSRDAKAYLGSPAVVAASAVAGYICAPEPFERGR